VAVVAAAEGGEEGVDRLVVVEVVEADREVIYFAANQFLAWPQVVSWQQVGWQEEAVHEEDRLVAEVDHEVEAQTVVEEGDHEAASEKKGHYMQALTVAEQ